MGLDMYLNADRFYWSNDTKPVVEDVPEGYEVENVRVQAAYWRKANAIHGWFVKNVQDGEDECRPHYVSREDLATLRDTCKEVLADKTKAAELLPPTEGFFFGPTGFDKWYFEDLKDTVAQIDKALAAFSDKWDFEYRSSW